MSEESCLYCKNGTFPTELNGNLIMNENGICEGKCVKLNKSVTADSMCTSNYEEDRLCKIADIINEHNNKIINKIHKESNTMFWNGEEWRIVYNYD